MTFLDAILNNFKQHSNRNAFCIKEKFYTYGDLSETVEAIKSMISAEITGKQNTIGVIANDDLETYASILSIWFTDNIFVPVNPRIPRARNSAIIELAGIKNILTSESGPGQSWSTPDIRVLNTKELRANSSFPESGEQHDDDILYLLFTSGSTGMPKGVPISRKNLNSFINSFISYGYRFSPEDRFLQIYDLSFDGSFPCYVVPLATGSCIYTVPQDEIKYLYALKLIQDHDLTIIKMAPSTFAYLRPYFGRIRLEKVKYCLLGGEPLDSSILREWANCIPNSKIYNVYGPTEATIICLIYECTGERLKKNYNGIVAIGRPIGENIGLILDQNRKLIEKNRLGELYLAGSQITPGYWKEPGKNKESFIELEYDNKIERFYRTGDLAIEDEEGDYLFCGRIDEQVQVDGFRVELGEIEKHARDFLKAHNVAAVSVQGKQKTTQIHLFVENAPGRVNNVKKYLESKLPAYMIPGKIINVTEFPKSAGGKVNKTELKKLLD